jgi:hypothetical protein
MEKRGKTKNLTKRIIAKSRKKQIKLTERIEAKKEKQIPHLAVK